MTAEDLADHLHHGNEALTEFIGLFYKLFSIYQRIQRKLFGFHVRYKEVCQSTLHKQGR